MSIFNHLDTKSYLRYYISELPRKGRGEGTKIARHLKVSTTLVSQILAGEKSFTPEQAQGLCDYLGLQGLEADYLTFLVQQDRAGTLELKRYWKNKLDELRSQAVKLANRVQPKRVLNENDRAIFYSSSLYSAIRLFTSVGEEGKSLLDICERFDLSRAKASDILKFLVDRGLCAELKERYFLGDQSTHLEFGSPHLARHLSNWRLRSIQQSENLTQKELMYTAPVSLSKDDFELLREEMVEFIKKFLEKVHASPAEEIACFNMDFFWIK